MSYLFLSYAHEDLPHASRLVDLFTTQGVEVYWDQRLRSGSDFADEIEAKLQAAACALVLWSKHSRSSKWVKAEAALCDRRGILTHARIDDSDPPLPYPAVQISDLRDLTGNRITASVRKVVLDASTRVRESQVSRGHLLVSPKRGEPLTEAHLALIHTCWRAPKHDARVGNGQLAYRWDIALFGSRAAMDRVTHVTYFLHPAYEQPDSVPPSYAVNRIAAAEGRLTCFRLSQVANGHSLVRAEVKCKAQDACLQLSRYINLFNSSERITDYCV